MTLRLLPLTLLAGLGSLVPAHAFLTAVDHANVPFHCDDLFIPSVVDEMGEPFSMGGSFPADEAMTAMSFLGGPPACPVFNEVDPEVTVSIFNLSGRAFTDVWYVADQGTSLTNFDGIITSHGGVPAFKIDAVGMNTPLLFESMTPDGIWEAGEIWDFVIQDYINVGGLPADAFDTIGINSPGPASSGNILAWVIPEPGMGVLTLLGLGILAVRRRRC